MRRRENNKVVAVAVRRPVSGVRTLRMADCGERKPATERSEVA